MPELAAHVWSWFLELGAARGSNGFAPLPLSYTEIDAWSRLTGNRLDDWEVSALRALDAAYLNGYAKRRSKNQRA